MCRRYLVTKTKRMCSRTRGIASGDRLYWLSQSTFMMGDVEARYNYRLRLNEGQARSLQ